MNGPTVGQGAALPAPRYKGFPVNIGGAVFVVPAMSLRTVEAHWPRIQALQQGTDPMPILLLGDLLHEALLRNYPGIPRDIVLDHVDLDNWQELLAMLMAESGFRQWAEANAELGNPRAQQILAENGWARPTTGAGAPSLPTSPPAPAGPWTTAATS